MAMMAALAPRMRSTIALSAAAVGRRQPPRPGLLRRLSRARPPQHRRRSCRCTPPAPAIVDGTPRCVARGPRTARLTSRTSADAGAWCVTAGLPDRQRHRAGAAPDAAPRSRRVGARATARRRCDAVVRVRDVDATVVRSTSTEAGGSTLAVADCHRARTARHAATSRARRSAMAYERERVDRSSTRGRAIEVTPGAIAPVDPGRTREPWLELRERVNAAAETRAPRRPAPGSTGRDVGDESRRGWPAGSPAFARRRATGTERRLASSVDGRPARRLPGTVGAADASDVGRRAALRASRPPLRSIERFSYGVDSTMVVRVDTWRRAADRGRSRSSSVRRASATRTLRM